MRSSMAIKRTLDRRVEFDEKSRQYPIRALVPADKPRSYTWGISLTLDQGQEGACVGFSWSHDLAGKPVPVPHITNESAVNLYREAKKLDEYPGEDYEGSSVLGGAKAVSSDGYMREYRWSFSLQDMILAIGHAGPGVLGTNWYDTMMDPTPSGFVSPGKGSIAGGHAIWVHGVKIVTKKGAPSNWATSPLATWYDYVDPDKSYFKLHNSWGSDWGKDGDCYITFTDMDRLIHEDGEFCIPVGRTLKV